MQRMSLLMLLLVGVAGCAGLTVKPVPDAAADAKARGFRYYEPSPYLLVYTDNQGGLVSQITLLPDPTKKMSVKPYNRLASNNVTLDFDKGMLKQGTTEVDETAVPSALIAAAEKAVGAAIAAKGVVPPGTATTAPPPYLFKIVTDAEDGSLRLVGGPPAGDGRPMTINVTVGKPASKGGSED